MKSPPPTPTRRLAEILGTALAYLAGAHLGFMLETLGTNTTPVWPPSGIALAALLLCGGRVWPGIFLGAFLANVSGFADSGGLSLGAGAALSVPIALGNTLEAVSGKFLLDRFAGRRGPFSHQRGTVAFLLAIPVMCTVAATAGMVSLTAAGVAASADAGVIWLTWWIGDATGILVMTSLLVVWARPSDPRPRTLWRAEGILLTIFLLVGCAVIFGIPVRTALSELPVTFVLLPLFVWAAYRFEHRGATLAILAASGFSVRAAATGTGPFLLPSQNESLLLVQVFVSMVAITTLVLATEVHERRRAAAAFRASQEALLRSHKMEAVGRLAGGIAHDFNNLLQVILGHVSSLPKDAPATAAIDRAADRGARLVKQLLAYSRQQILRPRHLDLNQLVVQTGRLLEPLLGERIRLSLATAPERLTVLADRGNVERVILNLALNSREAMPEGGTIEIATFAETIDSETARARDIRAGDYACIRVRDDGIGMDETTLANIFDPFFTTKGAASGTGLGLATAYGIVRQSGGLIDVDSAPGRGTRFVIRLPLVDADAEITPEPESLRVPEPVAPKRVLLAEDHAEVRDVLELALCEHGYSVVTAEDGEQALRLYRESEPRFDAVVSDVMMPRMTGMQLAREIRALDPQAKVLLLSGHIDDSAVRDEAAVFLQKPFSPEELNRALSKMLER